MSPTAHEHRASQTSKRSCYQHPSCRIGVPAMDQAPHHIDRRPTIPLVDPSSSTPPDDRRRRQRAPLTDDRPPPAQPAQHHLVDSAHVNTHRRPTTNTSAAVPCANHQAAPHLQMTAAVVDVRPPRRPPSRRTPPGGCQPTSTRTDGRRPSSPNTNWRPPPSSARTDR